jgi:hypothetical protein
MGSVVNMENVKSEISTLDVRMTHVEKQVEEIKENEKIYMENHILMREAVVKLTVLIEKQDERMVKQDNQIDMIGQEISEIRNNIGNNSGQTQWLQTFTSGMFNSFFKVIVIIIASLLGLKISGLDITELFKMQP